MYVCVLAQAVPILHKQQVGWVLPPCVFEFAGLLLPAQVASYVLAEQHCKSCQLGTQWFCRSHFCYFSEPGMRVLPYGNRQSIFPSVAY